MPECVPANLLEKWMDDLQSILKEDAWKRGTHTDYLINKGMRHGLDQIRHKTRTWLRHQEKLQRLNRLKRKFLAVRRVNLSDGRYRKLEWYENDLFLTLAWRHDKGAERGELMLELQDTEVLSTTYLVYEGGSSFDDLALMARKGGLDAVRNVENQGEWIEKVWP